MVDCTKWLSAATESDDYYLGFSWKMDCSPIIRNPKLIELILRLKWQSQEVSCELLPAANSPENEFHVTHKESKFVMHHPVSFTRDKLCSKGKSLLQNFRDLPIWPGLARWWYIRDRQRQFLKQMNSCQHSSLVSLHSVIQYNAR